LRPVACAAPELVPRSGYPVGSSTERARVAAAGAARSSSAAPTERCGSRPKCLVFARDRAQPAAAAAFQHPHSGGPCACTVPRLRDLHPSARPAADAPELPASVSERRQGPRRGTHRPARAWGLAVHFHCCVIDGVFAVSKDGFAEADALIPADLAAVQQQVRARVLRWFPPAAGVQRLVIALQMAAFGPRIPTTECRKVAARRPSRDSREPTPCGRSAFRKGVLIPSQLSGLDRIQKFVTIRRSSPCGRR
jgi:hypothetical protein